MSNDINLVEANSFSTSKESRAYLLSLLNEKEQKMFKTFVKSLGTKF